MTQEVVSRMLAMRFGWQRNFREISAAMGPATTMATVLLAVKRFTKPTSSATPNSAARGDWMLRSIFWMRKEMPPA